MSEFENKYQLFEHFKSVKNPNLCRESYFQKKFENIYMDFKNSIFYSLDFSFKERLYLYFIDDYELKSFICKCGVKRRFHTFSTGYYPFCCHTCAANDEDVRKRTKETFNSFSQEYKNEINKKKSNGAKKYYESLSKEEMNNIADACYERFHSSKEKEKEYISKRLLKRKNWTEEERKIHHINASSGQLKRTKESWEESNKKQLISKKQNKTIITSKLEKYFEDYLITNNIPFEKQYRTELYPFACDFYILDKNIYIEIQGNWTHGEHPFDKNNPNDINIVNTWKEKNSPYYNKAIKDWTIRDVKKRNIAKNNNLNFLEIFPQNIEDLIQQFESYYEQL